MILDSKLNWKAHIKKKEMNWASNNVLAIGRYSELNIYNKLLLLYRQVLKPVWLYGAQLWGCSKKSNVKLTEAFQNKVLRGIINAPWYIRNDDIHRDLKMELVSEEIKISARKHEHRLHHSNIDVLRLLDNANMLRRLNRTKPMDLV